MERHPRERLTEIILNRRGSSSWEIIWRERTESHPNIIPGTEKSDPDPYKVGILHYDERIREILDQPILWMGTRKPIFIIQDMSNLLYQQG